MEKYKKLKKELKRKVEKMRNKFIKIFLIYNQIYDRY